MNEQKIMAIRVQMYKDIEAILQRTEQKISELQENS